MFKYCILSVKAREKCRVGDCVVQLVVLLLAPK